MKTLLLVLALGSAAFASEQALVGKSELVFGTEGPAANGWVTSTGIGMTGAPGLALFSSQLEKQASDNLLIGALVQSGLGSDAIVTISATARFLIPTRHKKFRPFGEAGIGLGIFSVPNLSEIAPHILLGTGFDYEMWPGASLGTAMRINSAPGVDGFFLSWSMVNCRLSL